MSLPREHKKSQLPWQDLAVFAVVAAFVVYSINSFVAHREATRAVAVNKLEPAAPLATPARSPASQAVGSTQILRVPCLHSGQRSFTSSARLLQISSPLCSGDDSRLGVTWHATNATSGEEILVFVNRGEKLLSTNYLGLRPGKNDLVFVADYGKGKIKTEHVSVTRNGED